MDWQLSEGKGCINPTFLVPEFNMTADATNILSVFIMNELPTAMQVSDDPMLFGGVARLGILHNWWQIYVPSVSLAGAFITACRAPESFSKGFMSQYYNLQSDDFKNSILKRNCLGCQHVMIIIWVDPPHSS